MRGRKSGLVSASYAARAVIASVGAQNRLPTPATRCRELALIPLGSRRGTPIRIPGESVVKAVSRVSYHWLPTSPSDRWILLGAALLFFLAGWMVFFYPFGLEWQSNAPIVASVTTQGKV